MLVVSLSLTLLSVPGSAGAPQMGEAEGYYHPWYHRPAGTRVLDFSGAEPIQAERPPARTGPRRGLPDGWVQRGNTVMPAPVANGDVEVDPNPPRAFEDIPGNKYPRKHTLFTNFAGAQLMETFGGLDNSAEGISVLAINGMYPNFAGGEATALAVVQAVENDLAPYGVRVVYLERPPKVLPYTMAMIGGDWTDTNIDSPAGGVAPTTDCGVLNQRHVVYVFPNAVGGSSVQIANTTSQEAGHAWGLDHSLNCDSVMSYCGGGDQSFSNTCDGLCEEECQGPNSIGCRMFHEMYCPEGSDAQNEDAELLALFGGPEPDLEPPTVMILEPEDGAVVEDMGDVNFRAFVDDDWGGMGWQTTITKDGEVLFDEVDYFKDNINQDFEVALFLTMLEAGSYVITVMAIDHADHVAEDTVTFVVGSGTPGTASGTGEESGDAGSGGTGDGDESGGSSGPEATDGGDKGGCGCTAGVPIGHEVVFVLAGLVLGCGRSRRRIAMC